MIETRKKRLELEMLERTAALEKEALAAAAECDVDLAQIADEEDEFLRSSSQDDVRSTGSKVRNWIRNGRASESEGKTPLRRLQEPWPQNLAVGASPFFQV